MGTSLIRLTKAQRKVLDFEREMNRKGWEWDYEEGTWVKQASQAVATAVVKNASPKGKLLLGALSLAGVGLLALFKRR